MKLFRRLSDEAARAAGGGEAAPLVEAACHIVDAVVLGIHEQLPALGADASVTAERGELAAIAVRFGTRGLVGEIGTRSRVALGASVPGELRFGLRWAGGLVMAMEGLELPVLPDAQRARAELRAELGEPLEPLAAYRWWARHKDARFPLRESKFHRVVESLHEQRGMKALGAQTCVDSFWGYLHTTDLSIEGFELRADPRVRGGVALTARLRAPRTAAEAEDRARVREVAQRMLLGSRAVADRLSPSAVNVAAMIVGPEVGQPGACPKVVAKLLSPARWWGPGEDGWHREDETWLCVDRRDRLGRLVEQQGRIIWRVAGARPAPEPPAEEEPAARCCAFRPPRLGRALGRRGARKAEPGAGS